MEKLSVKERAKVQASLGAGKAKETKLLVSLKGEKKTLSAQDLEGGPTLFIKNCQDCEFTVDGGCVKFLVEGCKRCKITLNGHVKTEVVEFWRSDECEFNINSNVKTLQLDLCRGLKLTFGTKENLGSIVWAGLHDFQLRIADSPSDVLDTGYEQMKNEVPDLNDTTDQFIIRIMDDNLLQELVVRLPNGFPTTEREAKEFDERQERNAEKAEQYLREMIKIEKAEKAAADEGKAEGESKDSSTNSQPSQQSQAPPIIASTPTTTTTTTTTTTGSPTGSPPTASPKEEEKKHEMVVAAATQSSAAGSTKPKPKRVFINM